MTFRKQLIEDGFVCVPKFITLEYANYIFKLYQNCKEIEHKNDNQVPISTHSTENFKNFVELLCAKTMDVAGLVGEMVLPTYAYSRIYRKGSVLDKHIDRPACEISFTVHLYGDKEWPIYMEKPNGEAVGVVLKPGDAVLYLGCDTPHWRNAYEGEEYAQVFLHYVLSNGHYWKEYFNLKHIIRELENVSSH